ncbi:LysE family translocator [Rhodovarius sp.]|uniref:LysE family translocator n=1 Tax=Rhodovarius sp. TaxID=2972673 RepID=UPI0033425916
MRTVEFVVAVLLLELTPGPNMAYLAALSLTRGRRAALAGVVGVALGLVTHAVLSALGMGALVADYPLVYEVLRWAGVAFMLFLAWEGWQGAQDSAADETATASPAQLLLRGFITNVLNPKSILFFVAVVPGFLTAQGNATARLAVLGALYVGIATAVHIAIVLLAAELRPWLLKGPRSLWVRRGLSLLLAGAAAWLAFSTSR